MQNNNRIKNKSGLLSIIVPVYNTEKYLTKCIDSLVNQSYGNIEIILVNDDSQDNSIDIINEYASKDSRIKVVNHEKNRGLFQARISGVESSCGEYLAFVDSDDFVSCDWFRPMIETLKTENVDMVLGNTVNVDDKGVRTYYNNYRSFNKNKKTLYGKELMQTFFRQRGECFIWHTVWNKVYKADFVRNCIKYCVDMPEPLIMGEDIAFSSVFYTQAQALAFCDNDAYFYVRHKSASTSVTLPVEKLYKNLDDIIHVFQFVEKYLLKTNLMSEVEKDFKAFKDKYFCIWCGNLTISGAIKESKISERLLEGFNREEIVLPKPNEFYFYNLSSIWNDTYEKIKSTILNPAYKIVSFDIFDTLIQRPLWDPRDILHFVPELCRHKLNAEFFIHCRKLAEDECRKAFSLADKNCEDVTIDEIYAYMSEEYNIPYEVAETYKEAEINAEIQLCMRRESGIELLELAKAVGKRVVLTSDMYLGSETIKSILNKNGIIGYDELYLSSKERKIKATGSLYQVMLLRENVSGADVIHIGDNWDSDIKKAQENGIKTIFLPKAQEAFKNNISGIYAGKAYNEIATVGRSVKSDNREFLKQLPLRTVLSIAANKLFDNPFKSFNKKSNYNADAFYMGYMALGMHILGLAEWIYNESVKKGYETIHFFARDGYLIKEVFDLLVNCKVKSGGKKISSTYFFATRKALFPYSIENAQDFYNLLSFIDYSCHTPDDILVWCKKILKPLDQNIISAYAEKGVIFDKKFESKDEFLRFIKIMTELSYDKEIADLNSKNIRSYMKSYFEGNCATFDIGYSGRLQSMICKITGRPIDAFYLHDNGYNTKQIATEYGFNVHCYFDYTPTITSIIRETLISATEPSCVDYESDGTNMKFIFDDEEASYSETYAINELHRGAIAFCNDVIDIYGDRLYCCILFRF